MFIEPSKSNYHLIIIGAGGTGGWLVQFASKLDISEITLVDGDIVEQKNLIRQNFNEQDIGLNKATVLAARYKVGAVSNYLGNDSGVSTLNAICDSYDAIPIIACCVDNNASRLIVDKFIQQYTKPVFVLDSGNAERHGQVVLYTNIVDGIERPVTQLPDLAIVNNDNRHPSDISCAEQSESAPQNIGANLNSAITLFNFINKITNGETIMDTIVYFNSSAMSIYTK